MTYRAPVNDMLFCMKELAGLEQVALLCLVFASQLRQRASALGEPRAR